MIKSKENTFNSYFSHIYIEREAEGYDLTAEILAKLPNSRRIYIDCYGDLFFHGRQSYLAQKNSPKLIIAKQKGKFYYKGSPMCDDFGHENFYYSFNIMNCIYDCEYCYLQGLYPSANCVVFVNIEEYFARIETLLSKGSVYLCISYDTDLMAFESIIPLAKRWLDFAAQRPSLTLELRTKSASFDSLLPTKATENVILGWTLSPEVVASSCEHRAPSLNARIRNVNKALLHGFKVRLCFDPILKVPDFDKAYGDFIHHVFSQIDPVLIWGVSMGPFRLPAGYLKKMRKQRPMSAVLQYPYEIRGAMACYDRKTLEKIMGRVHAMTLQYVEASKIFLFQ